jgi:hypothetical protein
VVEGDPAAVAIGISVARSLEDDVRRHLGMNPAAGNLLFLKPDRPLGRECLTSAGRFR